MSRAGFWGLKGPSEHEGTDPDLACCTCVQLGNLHPLYCMLACLHLCVLREKRTGVHLVRADDVRVHRRSAALAGGWDDLLLQEDFSSRGGSNERKPVSAAQHMLTQIASRAELGKCTVPTSSSSFILLSACKIIFFYQPHELIADVSFFLLLLSLFPLGRSI